MNTLEDINDETEQLGTAEQLIKRALDNPRSKQYAIHARCLQCEHATDVPGWRARIKRCAVSACTLRPFRPYQSDEEAATDCETEESGPLPENTKKFDPVGAARANPKSRRLAIRAYCWTCMGGGGQPNTQQAIADCGLICAIHHVRPYKPKAGTLGDASILRPLLMRYWGSIEDNSFDEYLDTPRTTKTAQRPATGLFQFPRTRRPHPPHRTRPSAGIRSPRFRARKPTQEASRR